jgi:hypothetical protein
VQHVEHEEQTDQLGVDPFSEKAGGECAEDDARGEQHQAVAIDEPACAMVLGAGDRRRDHGRHRRCYGDLVKRLAFDAEHRQRQDQRRDDDGAAADAQQAGQKARQGRQARSATTSSTSEQRRLRS